MYSSCRCCYPSQHACASSSRIRYRCWSPLRPPSIYFMPPPPLPTWGCTLHSALDHTSCCTLHPHDVRAHLPRFVGAPGSHLPAARYALTTFVHIFCGLSVHPAHTSLLILAPHLLYASLLHRSIPLDYPMTCPANTLLHLLYWMCCWYCCSLDATDCAQVAPPAVQRVAPAARRVRPLSSMLGGPSSSFCARRW